MHNKKEALILGIIFLLAAGLRLWQLGEIPATINGDETGSLVHSWQLVLGQIPPFTLTHDYSVPALIFIPKALMINILGVNNSLIAVRLSTSLFSILGLFMFYLILRKDASFYSAILATLLFSSSYWYLNFSRISWIAVDSVFFGLLFYYLLDTALIKQRSVYAILAGVAATFVWMNFSGGWIYLLAGMLVILPKLIKLRKKIAQTVVIVGVTFAITSSPMIKTVSTNPEKYFSRTRSRSIFNLTSAYYGYQAQDIVGIMGHQLEYALRGFLLFDPEVSNEWVENKRLMPYMKPAINIIVAVMFYVGIAIALLKRKGSFFLLVYILNIAILQLLSVYTPGWSRAIGVLPAIYYFAGLGIEHISTLSTRLRKPMARVMPALLLIVSLILAAYDVTVYWDWIQGEDFAEAQEPAIKVNEFARWQSMQLEGLEEGNKPFSIYEWQVGWDLYITEIEQAEFLDWNNRILEADGQWMMVFGEIKNLTMEVISVSSSEFVLSTPSLEGEIQLHGDATRAAGLQYGIENTVAEFEGVYIKPSQKVSFVVAFDVPERTEEAVLQANRLMWYKIGSIEQAATTW